jgi:chromosome segregation ATPase
VTTRATTKTTSIARHRGKISFPSLATRRRAVTTRATMHGDENARGGVHAMRARGAIEDAVVTPEFEHVLATMEEMHEAELRRVRDKYESEMATFKRFANDREGETAQAVLDAMQHILEESNRRIDELEAELARAASSAAEREEETMERLRAAERIGALGASVNSNSDAKKKDAKIALLELTLDEFEREVDEEMSRLASTIAALEKENKELQMGLEGKTAVADVAPAKDVDLSEDMEQLKEHIEQITTALEESEAEKEAALAAAIEEMAQERIELELKIQEMQAFVDQTHIPMGDEIDALKAAYAEREKRQEEKIESLEHAAAIGMEILAVKDTISVECEKLQNEIIEYEDENSRLANENAELLERLRALEGDSNQ